MYIAQFCNNQKAITKLFTKSHSHFQGIPTQKICKKLNVGMEVNVKKFLKVKDAFCSVFFYIKFLSQH